MGAEISLTPEMASRKLAVLQFIRRYWESNGGSPSLGEIGQANGISAQRVHAIVDRLEQEGLVVRGGGQRNIHLPDQLAEAVRVLRSAGWTVNGDFLDLPGLPGLPSLPEGLMDKRLMVVPELDYTPPPEPGDIDGIDEGQGPTS